MDKSPYIFIASSPYSGSTLLSFLLGTHPEIAAISAVAGAVRESKMDTYMCSCGERMLDCGFWKEIRHRMHKRGHADFNLANFHLSFRRPGSKYDSLSMGAGQARWVESLRDSLFHFAPGHNRRIRRLASRNLDFVEEVLDLSGSTAFLDATKQTARIKHLSKFVDVDLRVIHLVRDVRGNAHSRLKRNHDQVMTLDTAASRWVKENTFIKRNLEPIPEDKKITISFEQLCLNTDRAMETLFEFCGVEKEYRVDDFREKSQHILGNPMRLRSSSEVNLDEVWRNALSADDLQRIKEIAGPLSDHLSELALSFQSR